MTCLASIAIILFPFDAMQESLIQLFACSNTVKRKKTNLVSPASFLKCSGRGTPMLSSLFARDFWISNHTYNFTPFRWSQRKLGWVCCYIDVRHLLECLPACVAELQQAWKPCRWEQRAWGWLPAKVVVVERRWVVDSQGSLLSQNMIFSCRSFLIF